MKSWHTGDKNHLILLEWNFLHRHGTNQGTQWQAQQVDIHAISWWLLVTCVPPASIRTGGVTATNTHQISNVLETAQSRAFGQLPGRQETNCLSPFLPVSSDAKSLCDVCDPPRVNSNLYIAKCMIHCQYDFPESEWILSFCLSSLLS